MLDPVEFGKAMGSIVSSAIAPLQKRIEELEARQPEKGDPGKNAEPVDVDAVVAEVVAKLLASDKLDTLADLKAADAVAKHFEANPVRDGKDVDPSMVKELIAAEVAAIPRPKDGASATDDQVIESVSKYLKANPPKDGLDGVGLAGALIDREGSLIVTLTNGEVKSLGPVNGKDGADFTTFSLEYDGERTVTIKGDGGEITKRLDLPLDRGYWREGMACEKSDIVTHDGNAWLALRDTKSKPCIENKEDWRLFARKGRDGKDAAKVIPDGPVSLK